MNTTSLIKDNSAGIPFAQIQEHQFSDHLYQAAFCHPDSSRTNVNAARLNSKALDADFQARYLPGSLLRSDIQASEVITI
jgi:hypothetical protein